MQPDFSDRLEQASRSSPLTSNSLDHTFELQTLSEPNTIAFVVDMQIGPSDVCMTQSECKDCPSWWLCLVLWTCKTVLRSPHVSSVQQLTVSTPCRANSAVFVADM
jgi:hypothetical protein